MSYEKINHPDHYQSSKMEAIDVIDSYDLNFCLGSATKYILRAGKKPGEESHEDLKKALWYVERELSMRPHFYWSFFARTLETLSFKERHQIEAINESFGLTGHLAEALETILLASLKADRRSLLRTSISCLRAQLDQ